MEKIRNLFTPLKLKSWHKMDGVVNSLVLKNFYAQYKSTWGFAIIWSCFKIFTHSPLYPSPSLILTQKLLVQSLLSSRIAP